VIEDEQKNKTELPKQSSLFHGRAAQFGQARGALWESKEKWRFLLKCSPDAILDLERDGTILFVNHTVPSYTVEDTVGKTVYDLMPPEEHEKTRKAIEKVFTTDTNGNLTYVSPDSKKIFCYKPEEMVGTHFKNYLIKSKIPRVSQRFAENMRRKKKNFSASIIAMKAI